MVPVTFFPIALMAAAASSGGASSEPLGAPPPNDEQAVVSANHPTTIVARNRCMVLMTYLLMERMGASERLRHAAAQSENTSETPPARQWACIPGRRLPRSGQGRRR